MQEENTIVRGWAMQLHYGCKRDNDVKRFRKLGPDTGFDCIDTYTPSAQLADLLNALNVTDELPKTILCQPESKRQQQQSKRSSMLPGCRCCGKDSAGKRMVVQHHKAGHDRSDDVLANLGLQ